VATSGNTILKNPPKPISNTANNFLCRVCKQLSYSYNRNRVRWALVGLSQDGVYTDLFEHLSVNSLMRDLSNQYTTFNPPCFSLFNTFNAYYGVTIVPHCASQISHKWKKYIPYNQFLPFYMKIMLIIDGLYRENFVCTMQDITFTLNGNWCSSIIITHYLLHRHCCVVSYRIAQWASILRTLN